MVADVTFVANKTNAYKT